MFELNYPTYNLKFWFQGYKKVSERIDYDDYLGFAQVNMIFSSSTMNFENSVTEITSIDIDHLQSILKDYMNNRLEKEIFFEPMEQGFHIRLCNGLNRYLEDNDKRMELSLALPDGTWIDDSIFMTFILDEEEIFMFYDYLCEVTGKDK